MRPGIAVFDITTSAGGAYTGTGTQQINFGYLYAVEWIDGDLADGVDAVLSMTNTPGGVDRTVTTLTDANDDKIYYPRADTQDLAGVDNGGLDYPFLNGKLKLVVSSGGASVIGTLYVYYFYI